MDYGTFSKIVHVTFLNQEIMVDVKHRNVLREEKVPKKELLITAT